jgi:REP element-mobilizing transposase RayT
MTIGPRHGGFKRPSEVLEGFPLLIAKDIIPSFGRIFMGRCGLSGNELTRPEIFLRINVMPRQARLDIPGALHHIMVRGINKTNIFDDDEDKAKFLERLGQNVIEGKGSVLAWVVMDNHVHILFKSGRDGISATMRKQLTWYAQYYNRRRNRTGHLFENRYKGPIGVRSFNLQIPMSSVKILHGKTIANRI